MSGEPKTSAGKAAALKRLNARRIRTTAVAVASVLGVPVVVLQLLNLSCSTLGMFCLAKPATEQSAPSSPGESTHTNTTGEDALASTTAETVAPKPLRPATEVETTTAALETTPEIAPSTSTIPDKAWLGIRAEAVSPQLAKDLFMESAQGALITFIATDSPAARAGVQSGDVIYAVGGRTIEDAADLQRLIESTDPGEKISVELVRKGLHSFVSIDFSGASSYAANDASAF